MTSYSLRIFPAANERSGLENIDQSQRREFLGGFQQAFLKFASNFKEVNKKLIIVQYSDKLLKDLETTPSN